MENNIPTAEEFAWDKIDFQTVLAEMNYQEVYYLMQEFAKLHVEAALKEASENVIKTIYPLTNIK